MAFKLICNHEREFNYVRCFKIEELLTMHHLLQVLSYSALATVDRQVYGKVMDPMQGWHAHVIHLNQAQAHRWPKKYRQQVKRRTRGNV